MSHVRFSHTVPASLADTWALHERQGIVSRLTPGFSRWKVRQQADNLADGTTIFDLPGGLTWVGDHVPQDFIAQHRFTDTCSSTGLNTITGWTHVHEFVGDDEQTTITDTVHTNAPEFLARRMLSPVFAYRQNQLLQDVRALQRAAAWSGDAGVEDSTATSRTIAITGADGLVGTQLTALLQLAGHTVKKLSRSTNWDPDNPDPSLLEGVDALVHLAGHPIAGRFTETHVAKIRDSRVGPTRKLAELVAQTDSVTTFVCASAVGFYGHSQSAPATEEDAQGEGVLSDVVAQWEQATAPAEEAGKRVVCVRSGLVLAGGSPMLGLLSANVRAGGGRLGDGAQHMAWIALDDVVDIYHRAATDPQMTGVVNAVAPGIVTNEEFTHTLADVGGGLPLVPVPKVAPTVLLGGDGARELALADQNVVPHVLDGLGYHFRYPELAGALRHELGKEA